MCATLDAEVLVEPAALQSRLRRWLQEHQGVFDAADAPDGLRLTEVATGKTLHVVADEVTDVDSRPNSETGREYLVLMHAGRPPLAVADAGFVFALDPRNTGELHGAPPTMSFRDFRRLYEHLRHLVEQPGDRREALDLTTILIASLDGARAAGLPTQVEEGELELVLRRLEAGA